MATSYTENYHLPQWAADDQVLRTEFNEAMESIDAGISTAAAEKFVIGSYTGNGVAMESGGQFIELGFKPRFLIITHGWYGSSHPTTFLVIGEKIISSLAPAFAVQNNGFTVGHVGSSGVIEINLSEYVYNYIAFR